MRAPQRPSRRRYDVVFYTPWIGSILTSRKTLPPGGAETQILLLAKALARRGLRVAIIVFGEPDELPPSVDGVTIVPRPPYRKRRRVVEKLVEVATIWRALSRVPSHAVVVRGSSIEVGVAAMYARLARRRFVFSTAHIADFEPHRLIVKRRDQLIYLLGVRLANSIVVQTEEQVALCRSAFGRTPVLIRSVSSVADDRCELPEAFLWVGRLVSYKRPLEYVALARAVPEARFRMVGVPMPLHESERLLAEEVAAAARDIPNLELLAPCPHEQIEHLMTTAVASVNTAEFEGMPNVLLEAWSRGVPALVLEHDPGGVVSEHGLGDYADGSPERLAELARQQWATREDRDALAERCRTYIAEHHSAERVAEQWHRLLLGEAVENAPERTARAELTCAG